MSKVNETEQKIRTAMEHATPDVLEEILSSCNTQKGDQIIMMNTKKKNIIAAWAAVAACLLLICTSVFGINTWRIGNTVDSTIMLDVNPSISIKVNAKERVLEVSPMNDDAEVILDGMDLKGTELSVAVNAIIGAMLRNGYLSDIQNSILVTVENTDAEKSNNLKQQIISIINSACGEEDLDAAVLTQNMTEDNDLEKLANEYSISCGKAALIQKLIGKDASLTFEELAPLSVNEIVLIAESRDLDEALAALIEKIGSASDKAYIGVDSAKQIAFEDAGVTSNDIVKMEIELDSRNGNIVYEVEFETADTKFEYDILATDGTILESSGKPFDSSKDAEKEENSNQTGSSSNVGGSTGSESSYIGETAAKNAAFTHASVTESNVKYCNVWIEYEDGHPDHYEVEFEAGGIKYEYEIGLTDGKVLEHSEKNNSGTTSSSTTSSSTTSSSTTGSTTASAASYIGEAAAKSAALTHAGVTESDVKYCNAWIDYENGRPDHYEVEFKTGSAEYEYEIGLTDGKVLNYEKDEFSTHSSNSTTGSSADISNLIGTEAAKTAAFSDAGVTASSVTELKCQLDDDHNQYIYEVEFKVGKREYQYEIDAATGSVLSKEIHD